MTKELPLVTVITPAYNRASFLEETILSVLNQGYPNMEYIVLDDGSTDDTLKVIKKYEGKLKWDTHENMGETMTVNKGFSMSNGEIIGVVNSDDPLLPHAINKVVDLMMEKKELMVVYPDWNMIDDNGEIIEQMKTFDFSYIDMVRWHHCIPGPGAFFRREVAEDLKGRDPQFRYVGDLDFWFRAGLLGPFARIPETLATFRFHQDSASVSHHGAIMAEEHIRLVEKLYSLPYLPAEIHRIRREAYSSANYIAGCVCGSDLFAKRKYFLLALYYSPLRYLGEYKKRLNVILSTMYVPHGVFRNFLVFFAGKARVLKRLFKCRL